MQEPCFLHITKWAKDERLIERQVVASRNNQGLTLKPEGRMKIQRASGSDDLRPTQFFTLQRINHATYEATFPRSCSADLY